MSEPHDHRDYWRGHRCDVCRAAYALYKRAYRWGVPVDQLGAVDDDMERPRAHGRAGTYNAGCRCTPCRTAKVTYNREWRRRRRDEGEPDEIAVERAAYGDRDVTLTRLEMAEAFTYLNARGYSSQQIADRLHVTQRTVLRWRSGAVTMPHGRPRTPGEQAC